MTEFLASTARIRQFASQLGSAGGDVATVGGMDVAASVAALGPVFGLIGADFVTVFGAAQTSHAASIGKLAAVLTASGDTANAIATVYDGNEADQIDSLRKVAEGVL
ncbi:type VII secretion target [Tomitella biformata]|uniref:type VII secretion target n=1 Tax=Tomitella biformata TaxID=630403 RepID=UPI00046519CB|nr:type VII secretion target [Tomitella biformata]